MNARPLPKSLPWILLGLLIIIIAVGVGRALVKRNTQQSEATQAAQLLQTAPVFELVPADWMTATQVPLAQTVGVSGSIKALQSAMVKARVAGELQGLDKREGQSVREGEVLMKLSKVQANTSVQQGQSRLQTLGAQQARLEAEAEGRAAIAFPPGLDALIQTTERAAFRELAAKVFTGPDPSGADIPTHDLDEFYLVASWFRRRPTEKARTRVAMRQTKSSPT